MAPNDSSAAYHWKLDKPDTTKHSSVKSLLNLVAEPEDPLAIVGILFGLYLCASLRPARSDLVDGDPAHWINSVIVLDFLRVVILIIAAAASVNKTHPQDLPSSAWSVSEPVLRDELTVSLCHCL